MRNFPVVILLSLLCILTGCKGNKFEIEFDLSEDVSSNYSVVYYASNKSGGFVVQAVAPVMNGKYIFNGATVNPALLMLSSRAYPLPLVIYVERGEKIKVEGQSASPYSWQVGGNKINGRLSAWRNENDSILEGGDVKKINSAVAAYVRENPGDPASALLLLTTFDRNSGEGEYRELLKTLEGEAKDPKWLRLTGRADQPDMSAGHAPASLVNMVMRKYPKGADTLRVSSAKASLLIFRNMTLPQRKVFFDSIKAISKEFPDSASRLIADICVDGDSIGWRSQVRGDTIRNVARLWTPAGLADENIMKLGVTRSPFFIVMGPEGKQLYRGSEMDSAMNEFRRLMK